MNRLSIIGAGSAGAALIQNLKIQNYDVVVGLRSLISLKEVCPLKLQLNPVISS